jgi:hypothetical protein
MDQRLTQTLEERRKRGREMQEARRVLSGHLAAGEWEAARAAGLRLSEIASTTTQEEVALKVEVLARLTAEQRKALAETYPTTLASSWLIQQRLRARPRRQGGGSRGGPPP